MAFVHCYGCGSPVPPGAPCRYCLEDDPTTLALREAHLEERPRWEYAEVLASVRRKEVNT